MDISTHDIMLLLAGAGAAAFWITSMMATIHLRDASRNYLKALRLKKTAIQEAQAPTPEQVTNPTFP